MKLLLAFLLTSSIAGAATFTTLKVGDSSPIDASALLEIKGTTGAVLFPRMTTTQKNAIPSPKAGDLVYDITLNAFSFYDGSVWGSMGGGGSFTFADSLVNTAGTVTLVNDSATPGASKYYGTNGGGSLGYYALPTSAVWGSITGTLSSQTDLQTALNSKQDSLTFGSISTSTTGVSVGSGSNSTVGPNVTVNIQTASGSQPGLLSSTDWSTFNNKQSSLTFGNLTDVGTDGLTVGSGTGAVIGSGTTLSQHVSDSTHNGYLSFIDWGVFNNKQDKSFGNYITNSDFEVNTTGWNLYNDSGNTTPAYVKKQDITFTSALSGSGGNGATISYTFCGSSYVGPVVTCPSGTAVQVCWYNGPTLAQNPTATVLKAAYDAQSCATAIATSAITGTAGNLQFEDGTSTLGNGGDAAPVDGTGGVSSGVTFTQNTSTPLVGSASGDLGKTSSSEQGQGVSTDFTINSFDLSRPLQISFVYQGSSGMVLGSSSDVRVFVYDTTNNNLLPVTPLATLAGPVSTAKQYVGQFTATTSTTYRLILHIATTNATAWDLLLDSVVVNDAISPVAATQVPSVVLAAQPISGAVTDHMVVMWSDGASNWVPATQAFAIPVFGTDITQFGFATNIVGLTADIYIKGAMGGFSFGPFVGFEQYVDTTAGGISPLPSPFTDTWIDVGKAISATVLNIQFNPHYDLITNGSGTPIKGGLLTNNAANNGSGDTVLAVGGNGTFLMANSAAANGIAWTAPVATAPITYTASTHTIAIPVATGSVNGYLASTDWTTFNNKAPTASPTFTGTVTLPAINLINGATNGTNTVLVYKNGHVKSTITTAPTAVVNANAGTSGTCSLTHATDSAGIVTLVTGSGSWASGDQCDITFNAAYGVAPICQLTPTGANGAAALPSTYLTSSTTVVSVNFASADTAATTYTFNYYCIETQ